MHLRFTTVRHLSLCGLVVLLLMTSAVVSAGLIHRRDALGVPSRAVCPFTYVTDCDPNRIPHELMKAEAADSNTECLNVSRTDARVLIPDSTCVLFNYTINVQQRNNTDGSWTDATQELPVSRICVFPKNAN